MTGMPVSVPAVIGAAAILIVQDVLYLRRHRPSHNERVHGLLDVIEKEIEWPTLSVLRLPLHRGGRGGGHRAHRHDGQRPGLGDQPGTGNLGLSEQGTVLFAALMILWASGFLSALIDNIPYVAVTIPIVARLIDTLPGHPTMLWWALALGACLGGNGTA